VPAAVPAAAGAAARDPELLVDLGASCGESPIWDPALSLLWWTDTASRDLYAYDPATGRNRAHATDRTVRAVGRAAGGRLVLVAAEGLYLWTPGSYETSLLCDPERGRPGMLPNDGTVDPAGRFLFGTFDSERLDAPVGSLYSIGAGGAVSVLDSGLVLPNGMAFSPDGKALYLTEMFARRILRYDYDPATGRVSGRSVFARVPAEAGLPDGLVVDAEGFVWSAHWTGWRITRYSPGGAVDRVLPLPFATATCVGFGGPALGDLYVTSAKAGLSPEELARSRSPGGLFVLRGEGRGREEGVFAV